MLWPHLLGLHTLYNYSKNISQQTRIIFALRIYLYNTIGSNVTVEGILPCVLVIASILFWNYYALFHNLYYLQRLFLENNIITNDAQRKNTVYKFQLKSFEHNKGVLFWSLFQKKWKINKRDQIVEKVQGIYV